MGSVVRHRVRAGISAVRRSDGSVDLEVWSAGEHSGPTHVEHFTANEWVDLVAAVSAGGADPHPENVAVLRGTIARLHVVPRRETVEPSE